MQNQCKGRKRIKTGFLNYFIRIDINAKFIQLHKGIKSEILNFKPKNKTKKSFMSAYRRFIKHKNTLNLKNFGFIETIHEPSEGSVLIHCKTTFYHSPLREEGWDSWAEVFEGIHLGLL